MSKHGFPFWIWCCGILFIGVATPLLSVTSPPWMRSSSTENPADQKAPAVLVPDNGTLDISRLLDSMRSNPYVPGIAAVVVHGGKIVGIGAAGNRVGAKSVEIMEATEDGQSVHAVTKEVKDSPMTIQDKLHLGALTQSMTAMMIAKLIEEGKLPYGWDTKITDVFPALAIHEGFQNVSLRQLLSHRSGLPTGSGQASERSDSVYSILQNERREYRPEELRNLRQRLMEQELAKAPHNTPGTFFYSTMGPVIAAHMAEEVMNQTWEALMEQYLFSPLQMSSYGFGAPGTRCLTSPCTADQPWGHSEYGWAVPATQRTNADFESMSRPAGGVHLRLQDWATYANMHLQALQGNPTYLSAETFSALQEASNSGDEQAYALGWWVGDRPHRAEDGQTGKDPIGASGLTHDGNNSLWYATSFLDPNRDLAILVVTNMGGDYGLMASWKALTTLLKRRW